MLNKRIAIALCGVIIFAALTYLICDITVMDDVHPDSLERIHQSSAIIAEELISDAPGQPQNDPAGNNPPAARKGWHMHINLDACMMYVYKDGQLLKTYPVSGGKPRTPTPLGTWKIISKDTWGEGFGGAWLGFNVPWGTFHQEHI